MKRKLLTTSLVLLLSMTMFSGCGDKVEQKRNVANIEFSWWGNDDRHKYTMEGVSNFVENNPDIDVKCHYGEWAGYERKNRVWIKSQTEADVMQINYAWLNEYSKDGSGYYDLYELKDYIDLSQYDENELSYGVKNGKLNAIPIAFNTSTMCYNKAILDKYNLECPKTWDDLFIVAETLSKDNIYTIGMSKKHMLLMLIAYYEQTKGTQVFDEDGRFLLSEDELGYILDFYKELIDRKVLMPIDQFDVNKLSDGEVAMSIFWISDADNYCGSIEKNGGEPVITSYLKDENAILSGIYMKPATMYAISNITDNPKEAALLLDYLVNSEEMAVMQGTEKGVPVSDKAVAALEKEGKLEGYGYKAYEKMQESKDEINIMIPIMESESIMDAFKNDADEYIYNVSTREETLSKIYKDINDIVNK